MLQQKTLADIIREKVSLGPQNSRGFYDVRCAVCSDNKPRGGFKFDEGTTGFSCYNCGSRFRYEEGSGKISKNARQVLDAFNITREDLYSLPSAMFVAAPKEADVTLAELQKVKLHTPAVPLPEHCQPLGSSGHEELQAPLISYLLSRKIDPLEARACFSLDTKYLGRVIIPFYRDSKVIYWQARHIDGTAKPRYLNSPAARDAVMFGYDHLHAWSPKPLFVTEGVFDAISLGGICTLGSVLNEAKLEVLKRSRRRLIFVMDPDKTGDGYVKQALDRDWEVSFFDKRGMDANQTVIEHGLPYAIYTLLKNATRNRTAQDIGRLLTSNFGTYK
jgi:hypothetical protein